MCFQPQLEPLHYGGYPPAPQPDKMNPLNWLSNLGGGGKGEVGGSSPGGGGGGWESRGNGGGCVHVEFSRDP
jgi:hypothetical protein